MGSQTFEEIKAIIPKIFYPKKREITADMELEEDLGITGDDADEFIMTFSERFNVSTKNFKSSDYFASESEDPFQTVAGWLFGKKLKKNGRKRITLGDLEKAVEEGELI